MIISILNEKGGVGKTTIAINLAKITKILTNESVLLIDSDPQGSARDWHESNDGEILEVVGLDRATLDKDIIKFTKNYKYIFVDGAPQLTELAIKAIIASDIVLIPVQPSPYDLWASKNIVDLIKQRQEITDGSPKAAFIVSRQIIGTNIGKEVREVLKEYELPVFTNGTYQRISYAVSAAHGQTIFDWDDDSAKKEMILIGEELQEFIE